MTPTETGIIVVHVRKHEFDYYIGRVNNRFRLNHSLFANPFKVTPDMNPEQRAAVIDQYGEYALKNGAIVKALQMGFLLNKRIACWCYQEPSGPVPPAACYCHGDKLRILQAELYAPEFNIEEIRQSSREAYARAEECGFIVCPGCKLPHTAYTLRCRQCGYQNK